MKQCACTFCLRTNLVQDQVDSPLGHHQSDPSGVIGQSFQSGLSDENTGRVRKLIDKTLSNFVGFYIRKTLADRLRD